MTSFCEVMLIGAFSDLCSDLKSRGLSPAEVDQLFLADVNKDGRLNEEELTEVCIEEE